jgi:hypothetical protein
VLRDDVEQADAAGTAGPVPIEVVADGAGWSWPPEGPLHPAEGSRFATEDWAPPSVVRHPWVRVGRWTVLYRPRRRRLRLLASPALLTAVAASWLLDRGRRRADRRHAARVDQVPRRRHRTN